MSIVNVDCEDLEKNPSCPHGPTLKFTRMVKNQKETFFACAAFRDRKLCPFYLLEGTAETETKKKVVSNWTKINIPQINHRECFDRFQKICEIPVKERNYCLKCHTFFLNEDLLLHDSHNIYEKCITHFMLRHPSKMLVGLVDNKKEAQFWFSYKTVNVISMGIRSCGADGVLCIGTPSVHEACRDNDMMSVLLDIDHRFLNFYSQDEFCWFNMFNLHFFDNAELSKRSVSKILKLPRVSVVIDPPFGARIEPLKKTIQSLREWHLKENEKNAEFQVFLILPYFMRHQIVNLMPELQPIDYQVEYVNHRKFKTKSNGRKTSPVIIFTNADRSQFLLPESEGYKYCIKCKLWVGSCNNHCELCNSCPSFCGDIYVHCNKCSKCVKKAWYHCKKCDFCVNSSHVCGLYKKVKRGVINEVDGKDDKVKEIKKKRKR